MHNPVVVFAGAIDEDDRQGTDGDQHQKSRCQQESLPGGASAFCSRRSSCRAKGNQVHLKEKALGDKNAPAALWFRRAELLAARPEILNSARRLAGEILFEPVNVV